VQESNTFIKFQMDIKNTTKLCQYVITSIFSDVATHTLLNKEYSRAHYSLGNKAQNKIQPALLLSLDTKQNNITSTSTKPYFSF